MIWQTGSNDPMSGVSVERFTELTRAGILAMRAAGADVVLKGPAMVQEAHHHRGLRALRRSAARRRHRTQRAGDPPQRDDARWAAQGLLSPTQMIGPDGLHMTDAGYDRLARAATAQLLASAGLAQDAASRTETGGGGLPPSLRRPRAAATLSGRGRCG